MVDKEGMMRVFLLHFPDYFDMKMRGGCDVIAMHI